MNTNHMIGAEARHTANDKAHMYRQSHEKSKQNKKVLFILGTIMPAKRGNLTNIYYSNHTLIHYSYALHLS